MGIKALIGPAGSGKTYRCITALCADELAGRQAVMIVPDQFTYAADRLLLSDPRLAGTRHVTIQSFQRLTHRIMIDYPRQQRLLTEQGRRMLLRRVVDEMSTIELGPLARVKETLGFVDALATTVKETKGIAGRDAASRLIGLKTDNKKINVIGEILARYDAQLANTDLIDPEEWVHAAADYLLQSPERFHNIPIWIDGFASFTPADKVLLTALERSAAQVQITICADIDDAAQILRSASDAAAFGISPLSQQFFRDQGTKLKRPAFLPTLRSLVWLQEQFGHRFQTPHYLERTTPRYQKNSPLARLEKNLFCNDTTDAHLPRANSSLTGIYASSHSFPYQEVVTWARWIDQWTRLAADPVHYRDIAVVIRSSELYTPLISEVFQRFQIPFFADRRRDATAHPVLRLALAALRLALQGWNRQAVIAVLRNPILSLAPETVDRLENLSLEYGIEYERWWKTAWEPMHLPARETPAVSFDEDGGADPVAETVESEYEPAVPRRFDPAARRRELAGVEARRISNRYFPALKQFTGLWSATNPSFAMVAEGLRELLSDFLPPTSPQTTNDRDADLIDRLSSFSFTGWEPDENERVYGLLQTTLQTGEEMMGETPVTAALVTRLLREAFSNATIGNTPRILDAVIIGEPRRSRVNEVKKIILGGLDAASVPRGHTQDPLFSDNEREQLSNQGLPLAATAALQAEEETYVFYIACTRATEEMRLTYSTSDASGAPLQPSAYLSEIYRALGGQPAAPAAPSSALAGCHHERELATALAATLIDADPEAADQLITAAEAELPFAVETIRRGQQNLRKIQAPLPGTLSPEAAAAICPAGLLATSASRLEEYAKCPFRHFARHLLKIEPRPEAVLTPRSTGSAVHEALQKFFSSANVPTDGDQAVKRIRKIYAKLSKTENYRVFQEDPPSEYRWRRTGYGLEMFIRTEMDRLRDNGFQPVAHELAFGLGQPQTPQPIVRALLKGQRPEQITLPPLDIAIPPELLSGARFVKSPPRLRLRGMIDRLDIIAGDNRPDHGLIIDYKASTARRNVARQLDLGLDLQMAVYLIAVSELLQLTLAGGIYYGYQPIPQRSAPDPASINPLALGMDGIFLADARDEIDHGGRFLRSGNKGLPASEADGITATLGGARKQVIALAARIISGDIRAYPARIGSQLPCEYCEFNDLCRFDPRCHAVRRPGSEEGKSDDR